MTECVRNCICKVCIYGSCCENDCSKSVFYSVSRQCLIPENIKYGIKSCNEFVIRSDVDFDNMPNSFYKTVLKRYNFSIMMRDIKETERNKKALSENKPRETDEKAKKKGYMPSYLRRKRGL